MKTSAGMYLSFSPDDLYRFGNSTSPRLDNVRENDIEMYQKDGTTFVCANGKGISLLTRSSAIKKKGWAWLIPKNTMMPHGLVLNPDFPGHVSLCPVTDMSLESFRSLLLQLAVHCVKMEKQ